MATRSHALVVGYRRDQLYERLKAKIPPADIVGGRCISCNDPVYVNLLGVDAIRTRSADVICEPCDKRFGPEADRSLVES